MEQNLLPTLLDVGDRSPREAHALPELGLREPEPSAVLADELTKFHVEEIAFHRGGGYQDSHNNVNRANCHGYKLANDIVVDKAQPLRYLQPTLDVHG